MHTVPVPFQAALQLKPATHKNMLIFVFYSIFKLEFHKKKELFTIETVAWNGTSTVAVLCIVHLRQRRIKGIFGNIRNDISGLT